MSDYKPIVKLLQANAHSRHLRDVFTDFVEMSALSLRNAISKPAHDIPVLAQASSWDDVFAGIGGAA